MTGTFAFRASLALLVFAALLLLGACAVPFAPGYQIEQQHMEVRYVAAPPVNLHIRATYRLKNTGTADLDFLEVVLPDEQTFGRQNLRAQVDGREVAVERDADSASRSMHIRLAPSWAQKQRRSLVFEYDLAPAPPGHATLAVNDGSFHIRDAAAFPILRPPKGFFAKGGEHPTEITLAFRVPTDFRVFAGGRERGSQRRSGETEARFRLAKKEPDSFVVAGRYQEKEVSAGGGRVIFWSFEPLEADQAQAAATRLAATFETYRTAFGPIEKIPPPVRMIETHARLIQQADSSEDAAGVAIPAGALLNRQAFALGITSDAFLDLAEHELANTWFGQAIVPRRRVEPALGEGLIEYAVLVAAEARGGEAARRAQVALLLRRFDESRKQAADKPLLRIEPSDPFEQRIFGYSKGALFFVALEDQYGKENVRRALSRLVSSLRGEHFGFAALMSTLELETGQKLGEFFRLWLDQTGIPAEVRSRYEQETKPTK